MAVHAAYEETKKPHPALATVDAHIRRCSFKHNDLDEAAGKVRSLIFSRKKFSLECLDNLRSRSLRRSPASEKGSREPEMLTSLGRHRCRHPAASWHSDRSEPRFRPTLVTRLPALFFASFEWSLLDSVVIGVAFLLPCLARFSGGNSPRVVLCHEQARTVVWPRTCSTPTSAFCCVSRNRRRKRILPPTTTERTATIRKL